MRHTVPSIPQFYVTAPQGCPYLGGREERKIFTSIQGDEAQDLSDCLSKQGFRRSQNVLYRPSCTRCSACLSVRIHIENSYLSKNQKRMKSKHKHLKRSVRAAWATEEQFELFHIYLNARHYDGGMVEMNLYEYAEMIEETPVQTRIVEYRDPMTDRLVGCSLADIMDDGLSMVYSFYDPSREYAGLGSYMILDHVDLARNTGLPYVYLGYWVPTSPKMAYKARFRGLEVYHESAWAPLKDSKLYEPLLWKDNHHSIPQQVARIHLPNGQLIIR